MISPSKFNYSHFEKVKIKKINSNSDIEIESKIKFFHLVHK